MAFDREKFRELVSYVSQRLADDRTFGDVKLNKILYFVDFFGYSHLGRPVTGAEYHKQLMGPLARPLLPVRQELEQEGAVAVEMRPAGSMQRRVTAPLREPDMSRFNEDELQLIDDVIGQLRGYSAEAVSRISHRNSAGWQMAEIGEAIPYETALIARDRTPNEVRHRGQELAARFGW